MEGVASSYSKLFSAYSKKMMSAFDIRNERLTELSQMVVNGQVTSKLDSIATIHINSRFYFNVFRRYNSPYNIVIEDYNGDIYLHQDHTIRTSLKTVLCLQDYQSSNIYTWNATSFKHNGPVPSIDKDLADMRWSEIQAQYQAVSINFGGIFYGEPLLPNPTENMEEEDIAPPSTPIAQMIPPILPTPLAPSRPTLNTEDNQAANILFTLSIPKMDNTFKMSESDGPTLSMRFADILKRQPVCYCEMHESDDESEYDTDDSEYEDEDLDENNYIVLRNGTMIPKAK